MRSLVERLTKLQIFWCAILFFVCTIPFPQVLSIRVLLFLLLFSFFVKGDLSRLISQSWDAYLYLLILSIGLLYSDDLETGWREVETTLSLLAIPIVFAKIKGFSKKNLHWIFYAFAAGLFVACLICFFNAAYQYFKTGRIEVFFFDQLVEIIDFHPTYLAYYLIAVITFGLYLLYYEKTGFSPFVVIVCLIFFFLILMLTGGLTAFVSILLVFSFFILKFMLEEKSRRQTLTFGIVLIMIVGMFVFSTLNQKEKNDYWERFDLWESTIKATPNMMFGVGTGDYENVSHEYYVSHHLYKLADLGYNSHNQFIEIFFTNGLIGLLSVIILIGRPLYLSVRSQNIFGTLTFFPFIIYGMTEVFLGRYQGVVFFALLHQSFMTYYLNHKPSFIVRDV